MPLEELLIKDMTVSLTLALEQEYSGTDNSVILILDGMSK